MINQTLLKDGLRWIVAISLGVATVVSSAVEQGQSVKDSQAGKPAAAPSAIIYRPLFLDAPRVRVDGPPPGTEGKAPILQVLTPEHAGLTLQRQPTLYWYAGTPTAVSFELTQISEDKCDPLLKVEVSSKKDTNLQQLDLGDHDISLQPEVAYTWSVALVTNEGNRSAGVSSSGVIERMEPGEGLTTRIKDSHGTDLVNVYAIEGIWYDALETISSMIKGLPADRDLAAIRASLLNQAGLHAVTAN